MSDGWPSSPEQMADYDDHYASRRPLDAELRYLIPNRDHSPNYRINEWFGRTTWKPGDPVWARQGQHCRHLFDLMPTVYPDLRSGQYWCHHCDVTWDPGVRYDAIQESDVQPCWNCNKLTWSPCHPAEKIRRIQRLVYSDHGYTCEEIAEHFNIKMPGPEATPVDWQWWADRVRRLMYSDHDM